MKRTLTVTITFFYFFTVSKISVRANGINRDGTDAESMSMGGTDVGWAQTPLEAMGDNPAGLGYLSQYEIDLGGVGAIPNGTFDKPSQNISGSLNNSLRGFPETAIGAPVGKLFGKCPVSMAVSFVPQSMLLADWHYLDPVNSGGISYGYQEEKSEILVLRTAVGVGVQVTPKFSLGVSLGAAYNKNELVTPYVFQNVQPTGVGATLDGAKTLLDLNTEGWGWNAQVGMLYCPITNLQFGLSYQNKYKVVTTGSATGNAYAQFGASPGSPTTAFNYDAEVDNNFPNQVNLGGSWKLLPQWRLAAEVDWIGWAGAFHTLPVKLSNGSEAIGTAIPQFQDNVPLNWKNEFVYRAGLEYALTKNVFLRGGYAYGSSPVPDSTLTPMTAAIGENTITAGIGYRWHAWDVDLAYQCDLPATQSVGTSALRDGEYSNSSTKVFINWFALTVGFKF